MVASFVVELEKLRRRPASWVLAGILVVFIAVVGYALNYVVLSAAGGGAQSPFARMVMPSGMPSNVLTSIPSIGAALSVILGAMFMGSEYRWDTVKANVVRRPGRIGLIGGKLAALLAATAVLALVALLTGLVCSVAISLLQGAGFASPPLQDTVAALGVGWLVLAVYAVLGLSLGVLVRGSGAAVAFGLVYVLILESLISSAAGQIPGGQIVSSALPGGAAQSLTGAIGQQGGPVGSDSLSSPFAAIAVLGAWLVLLAGASLLLFSRRDAP